MILVAAPANDTARPSARNDCSLDACCSGLADTKEKEAAAPAAAPPMATGWGHILAVFQVPELNVAEDVQEAISSGSYLLLYALLLHKRPLCQSLSDEAKLIEEVLDWTAKATPT